MSWMIVKGTEVKQGDVQMDGTTVVRQHAFGRLLSGAQYLDVVLDNGEIVRLWEGFLYRVRRGAESIDLEQAARNFNRGVAGQPTIVEQVLARVGLLWT